MNMSNTKRRVLILGGGFGGTKTALDLAKDNNFEVSLISDHTDFRYYPTLYRTATGGDSSASSIPLSEIFQDKNVKVIKDKAISIDRANNLVNCLSKNSYPYDILVIALGVVTNYFGIRGLEKFAYGIKSLDEAKKLRAHLHDLIADDKKPDLNYVIIGGGPTGVELAGALPDYLKEIMRSHGVPSKTVHIDIVEAAAHLVPRMNIGYSRAVEKRLKKLAVRLLLKRTVEAESAESLMVSGHSIKSHTVVWTAGVTNHPFLKANGFILNNHGKVVVDKYLQAEDNIYVIGDNADTPYSGMAQTALYDAVFVSKNIRRVHAGKQLHAYTPKRPVYVTPAGRKWAIVQWGPVRLSGRVGWWLRDIADFIAFHRFEPWWKASRHWVAEFETESECLVCKK